MDGTRLNIFWFLSLLTPLAIMLVASAARKKWISFIAGLFSIAATYWLCLLAVVQKWDTRAALATTDAQRQWVYDHDGANQAFTAVVTGPAEALLYTVFWGMVGWKLIGMYRSRSSSKSLEQTRDE